MNIRYQIDIAAWILPDKRSVNTGMVALLGKIAEDYPQIIFFFVGNDDDFRLLCEYIATLPDLLKRIIGDTNQIVRIRSWAEFPNSSLVSHEKIITTKQSGPIDPEVFPIGVNGALYIVNEDSENGWVAAASELGLVGTATSESQVRACCSVIPVGKFRG